MDLRQAVAQATGKKILFLGKTKTMSEEDIDLFLDQVEAKRAVDERDEPIAMIVLGRLVNPVESEYADTKEREGIPVVNLEKLENYYAGHIDRDALLGSLKLFSNRSRIINLLHNRAIEDSLYCELLKLYDWEGKGPFETDENRDVAGTMVARFYPDIVRNHNIQYSPVGPFLVAAQSGLAPLLEAMAQIPDYEITQRSHDAWMPRTLQEALLLNPSLPVQIVERFWESGELRKMGFAARHPNFSKPLQKKALERSECWVHEGVARNENLSKDLFERLMKSDNAIVKNAFLQSQPLTKETVLEALAEADAKRVAAIASNPHLDEETLEALLASEDEALLSGVASNEALPASIYERLEKMGSVTVKRSLASNPVVSSEILERLMRIRDKAIFVALASNPSTPQRHLQNFSKIIDKEIMAALASNPSTPIEILLGYQTNADLANILKRNEAFGDYIKQNIGW